MPEEIQSVKLRCTIENEYIIIIVENNELGFYSSKEFADKISIIRNQYPITDIKLDLSNIEYIDSSFIGVLLILYKDLQTKGKKLILVNLKDKVYKTIILLKLQEFFIYE